MRFDAKTAKDSREGFAGFTRRADLWLGFSAGFTVGGIFGGAGGEIFQKIRLAQRFANFGLDFPQGFAGFSRIRGLGFANGIHEVSPLSSRKDSRRQDSLMKFAKDSPDSPRRCGNKTIIPAP